MDSCLAVVERYTSMPRRGKRQNLPTTWLGVLCHIRDFVNVFVPSLPNGRQLRHFSLISLRKHSVT